MLNTYNFPLNFLLCRECYETFTNVNKLGRESSLKLPPLQAYAITLILRRSAKLQQIFYFSALFYDLPLSRHSSVFIFSNSNY